MRKGKLHKIAHLLGKDIESLLRTMYLVEKKCTTEISEELQSKTNIVITNRSIQRMLNSLGIIRNKSEAYTLAIKKGRKDYSHLRKPIKSKDLRKGISLKIRYLVLRRDESKCVLCGNGAQNTALVIDHIKPVVDGGDNNIENLRTLCKPCNHGKMLTEERH